jgi:hypothetical protein
VQVPRKLVKPSRMREKDIPLQNKTNEGHPKLMSAAYVPVLNLRTFVPIELEQSSSKHLVNRGSICPANK